LTITKEEVLAHLNKELNRSVTEGQLEEYLLEALKDLSMQDEFLWIETTVPTIIGRPYYSEPLDYKRLLSVRIDDNAPLGKITWREYQVLIRDETSDDRDEPNRFTQHGGFWYPYPTPDAIYTATLFYNAFVLEIETIDEAEVKAVDNITFKDIYRDAIYAKTKASYCRGINWTDKAMEFQMEYERIILPPLKKLVKREPKFTRYTDL